MYKFIRKLIKGEEGIAYIKACMIILILLPFFGAVIDFISVHYIKNAAKDSLTYACEAAAKEHEVLQDNTMIFKKPEAIQEFYKVLKKNFNVDDSLKPLTEVTYVRDTIVVEKVELYDNQTVTLPYPDPITSQNFTYPTIHAVIVIPVRLHFLSTLGGIVDPKIRVHVDVSSEDFL